MPKVSGAPKELNALLEKVYASALKQYKGNKAKASKIAIGAAENAGWKKVDGKWTKAKKEMSEIVIDAFKEGEYPQGKFTGKELSEIASTYNPANYEAHDMDSAPVMEVSEQIIGKDQNFVLEEISTKTPGRRWN